MPDYVLERRMAENTKTVNDFLAELLAETKSYADADYRTVERLCRFARFQGAADALGLGLLHREIQG